MLPGAEVLVLGEFAGSAAPALEILRDVRAGAAGGREPEDAGDRHRRQRGADDQRADRGRRSDGRRARPRRCWCRQASQRSVAATPCPTCLNRCGWARWRSTRLGGRSSIAGKPVRLAGREMDVLVLWRRSPGACSPATRSPGRCGAVLTCEPAGRWTRTCTEWQQKFRAAGVDDVVRTVRGRGYKLNENGGVER